MNVSTLIATFGHTRWQHLARQRALPSALAQEGVEAQIVMRHHVDGTLAEARNEAAAEAEGDWLCFLDADDGLAPDYLEAMGKAWTSYGHPGGQEILTESGPRWTLPGPLLPTPLLAPAVVYWEQPRHRGGTGYETEPMMPNAGRWPHLNICVIGTLVRHDLFTAVGGFREALADGTPLTSLEDYDLFLRCWKAGAEIVPVPDAVYRAHRGPLVGRNRDQSLAPRIRAEHGVL